MLEGFKIYDADAHVMMTPEMWRDLPKEYALRRPRPVAIGDSADLAHWRSAWLLDGRLEPHPYGPGTHAANTPGMTMVEYGAKPDNAGDFNAVGLSIGAVTAGDVSARLKAMDEMGADVQMIFPSTLYATMSADAGLEAALFRCYNRYMAGQCKQAPKRLKWAGLLPMRDTRLGIEALEEMVKLGASAVVVFGTVGERMHSEPAFRPIWNAVAESRLPVCVHMAMSFPPFDQLSRSIQDANMIGKAMPAQLAFVSLIGHGMMERYPDMKVAFLEFGGEWIFYSVGRMTHYMEINKHRMADPKMLPGKTAEEMARSGRLFLAVESSDKMMPDEFKLLGDGQLLYSSDFPHGEGRDSAAREVIERTDITDEQKRKILYDNAVSFFGEP
jgi:predicted TIM-barrel fold metal-dependent hydrolase